MEDQIKAYCSECGSPLSIKIDEDGDIYVNLCNRCALEYEEKIAELEDEIDRRTARFNIYGHRIW